MNNAALVLSGGGALGAAHLGALMVLQEHGYHFDHLTGVSAGSIVAALLALGYSPAAAYDLYKSHKIRHLIDLASFHHGIIRGKRVWKAFDDVFGERVLEDLSVPLVIGATDFQTGERLLLRRGRITDALRASVSVPLLFEPFFHPGEKRWLVDGGITQNYPLDVPIAEYRGEAIIGIDVASSLNHQADFEKRERRWRSLPGTASRMMRIIFRSQQRDIPSDQRVLSIVPDTTDFTATDIFKMDAILETGRIAATKALAAINA